MEQERNDQNHHPKPSPRSARADDHKPSCEHNLSCSLQFRGSGLASLFVKGAVPSSLKVDGYEHVSLEFATRPALQPVSVFLDQKTHKESEFRELDDGELLSVSLEAPSVQVQQRGSGPTTMLEAAYHTKRTLPDAGSGGSSKRQKLDNSKDQVTDTSNGSEAIVKVEDDAQLTTERNRAVTHGDPGPRDQSQASYSCEKRVPAGPTYDGKKKIIGGSGWRRIGDDNKLGDKIPSSSDEKMKGTSGRMYAEPGRNADKML